MATDVGRSAADAASGYSAEPEPCSTVSAAGAVSIPNADDYAALKAYGHSPAKAAEIVLDAQRGDGHCRRWIELVRAAAMNTENRGEHS